MRNYLPLSVAVLLALGAGMLARHGWMEKDHGYFFPGAVLLFGSLVAVVRITANIVRGWRRSGG
jgi:hypothetical protein